MPSTTPTNGIAPALLSPLNGFAAVNAQNTAQPGAYFNPNYAMQVSTPQTYTPPPLRQATEGQRRALALAQRVDPTGALGVVESVVPKYAPSVVQVVNDLTGKMGFMRIPAGKLLDFHNLIDDTAQGIAGKTLKNGDIYHLTAKSPEQMLARGFEDRGIADVKKIPTVQPRDFLGRFHFK